MKQASSPDLDNDGFWHKFLHVSPHRKSFPTGSASKSEITARYFRRLYIVALSLIAGLAILGQVLVQRSLVSQRGGGHLVNQAGYQRMLSQRITLKLMICDETGPEGRAQIRAIESLSDRWNASHRELVEHLDEIAFGPAERAGLAALLHEVNQPLQRISAVVEKLAAVGALTESERRAVLADQEIFLPLMDAVVMGFEQSVLARVTFLQRVELGLLLLTLVVLVLEALLIFRPAVEQLQDSLEQLEQRGRQAARRLESLRHLAGGIAHSFNNLLTGIMGHAELQRFEAQAARQSTEFIDAQIDGCKRAAEIVSQLLSYSGYGSFTLRPTQLGSWLRELEPRLIPDGSTVNVVVDVIEESVAAVDRDALQQAIEGIVANGVESMTSRIGTVTVKVLHASLPEPRMMSGPYQTELPPGLYACIRVIDLGAGIAPDDIDGIFDPYQTRKEFGRGLGLAAILGIAHGHGGGIEVESKAGRGTTVSLYLPLLDTAADKATVPLVPAPPTY